MTTNSTVNNSLTRRRFLTRSALGLGIVGLARELSAATSGFYFPAKAKAVIQIFLNGGMSQVDTFDPKPELTRQAGKKLPYDNLQTGLCVPASVLG